MLDTALIKYVKGTVRFKAEGANVERFLNIAAEAGLWLVNLRRIDGVLIGDTVTKHYKQLAKCAKKTGVRLRITKKKGFPFWFYKYRKRWGIYAGICIFLLFLLISRNFVWDIEIRDYDEKKQAYLLQVMEECGLHDGAYIPNLDMRMLKQQVLLEMDDLAWITFNLDGTKVKVELSEKVKTPDIAGDSPCNVVARKTGQITYLETLEGQEMVKVKEIVSAGDLILSGIKVLADGGVKYVHADGKVLAQTVNQHSITFQLSQTEKHFTGDSKNRYFLELFGLKIPLFIAFDLPYASEVEAEYSPLVFFGQEIPVGIHRDQHYFYTSEAREYSEQEAKAIIDQGFLQYEQNDLKDTTILSNAEEVKVENGVMTVTRRYTCEEDIAQKIGLCINE